MKEIHQLNKLFESRIRLGILLLLLEHECLDYKQIKEHLEVTDGNLASHIASLEKNKIIDVKKQFIRKRPNTSYRLTQTGKAAYISHLDALNELLKKRV